MKLTTLFAGVALASALAGSADAVTISSYDIANATLTGVGNWFHTYSGTITPTSGPNADYTGGNGTLDDGVVGSSNYNSELFQGSPTITVYLSSATLVSAIDFLSAYDQNYIPGDMTSVDVTIGGVTVTYTPVGFGPINFRGINLNQELDLNSLQSSLSTSKVILSNFQGDFGNYTSIGELTISGEPGTGGVPEPATWAMMLLGVAGIGASLRGSRRRAVAAI